jgi:hypothetical protein
MNHRFSMNFIDFFAVNLHHFANSPENQSPFHFQLILNLNRQDGCLRLAQFS